MLQSNEKCKKKNVLKTKKTKQKTNKPTKKTPTKKQTKKQNKTNKKTQVEVLNFKNNQESIEDIIKNIRS